MPESTEQPVINIQGDTPENLARVLAYLYRGDYDDVGQDLHFRSTTAPSDGSDAVKQETKSKHTGPAREIVLNNMNVFLAAERFAIPPIKSLAELKSLEWVPQTPIPPWSPKSLETSWKKVAARHETKLQDVILAVIYMHIEEHVENPEMLDFFAAFGAMGSLIIEMLVKSGRVKSMVKPDSIGKLTAAFTSICSSEDLSGFGCEDW
ncbi:hypothetical protein PENSUB_1754 [Penicillium subrubescens]|uniref:BTB domain-containing protein n=1 Tax=Penicillium subrubescens TaxID=1316194 RepID=A0A1Q5UJK9_9EURO|nr:hypothetical protein PENSUB_1754 [Penicillium subrubescens]